jgi:hypothetical protein
VILSISKSGDRYLSTYYNKYFFQKAMGSKICPLIMLEAEAVSIFDLHLFKSIRQQASGIAVFHY